MTKYKVLFLDVDGTIVRPDDTIESSTKKAIADVQSQGIQVILTTGRPIHEVERLGRELRIHSYIGYNGGAANLNGKNIFRLPINEASVKGILTIARKYQHEVALHTSTMNLLTHEDSFATKHFLKKFDYRKNKSFTSSDLSIQDVLGATVINLKKEEANLYDALQGIILSQANVEGMDYCFDVIRNNVNKGTGVKRVLDYLGLPTEKSIAFGDGLNDKEMLCNVGEGFAMGNSHPDLFQYAKHRTTDVMDSGLYNGLKSLGLID